MLNGINKARIGRSIYTRHILDKTCEEVKIVLSEDGEINWEDSELIDVPDQQWSDWGLEDEFRSISLAKKANGRGSITFHSPKELPR